MSSKSNDDETDSDVSRFTLDGVVAEMVIEVEDNEQNSPSKSLKFDRLKDIKTVKSSALQESSDSDEKFDSVSHDAYEDKTSKPIEIESVNGPDKTVSKSQPDSSAEKQAGTENKITTVNESDDVSEKNYNLEDMEDSKNFEIIKDMEDSKDVEMVEDMDVEESETESVLEETKSLRDRKKIKSKSDLLRKEKDQLKSQPKEKSTDKAEASKLSTRSSVQKTNSNDSSRNASLKRGNKAIISSGKKVEVPEKRLKKSSEDNAAKKEKKSVTFNPVASKVTLSKRLSLRPIAPKIDLTRIPSVEGDIKSASLTTIPTFDLTTGLPLQNATPTDTPVRRSKRGRPPKNSPRPPPRPKLPSRGRGRPRSAPVKTSTVLTPIRTRTTPIPIKSKPFPSTSTPPSTKGTPVLSKARSTSNKDTPIAKKTEPVKISKAWNLVPDGKLESFPEIKKQVNQAASRALRSLHHILYGELESRNLDTKALREEILKFKGFSFKKNSDTYEKHLSILNRMSDSSINEIVKILNIKKKSVPSIMAFLLKPALQKPIEIIFCVKDPYEPSMQPVVKLPKMTLENSSFKSKESTLKTIKQEKITKIVPDRTLSTESLSNESITSKRKRFPSTKLRFYDMDFDSIIPKKKTSVTPKAPVPSTKPKTLVMKTLGSKLPAKKAVIKAPPSKTLSLKEAAVKRAKQRAFGTKKKLKIKKLPSSMVQKNKKPISSNLQVRRKALDLALEIQGLVEPSQFDSIEENDKFNLSSFEYEADIKEEVVSEDEAGGGVSEKSGIEVIDNATNNVATQEVEEIRSENASSEVTLSSDEAKEAMGTPQKKRCYKTSAIPLRSYPSIKANITSGNYNALQRLHIVLFGSADKAANLKGNLLSFGGFPFKKGSEEWRQKQFLLSLLTFEESLALLEQSNKELKEADICISLPSQGNGLMDEDSGLSKNMLKEYLDLLAIKYDAKEDQNSLISKFMNFLSAPIENLPEDNSEIREESEIETDSAAESPEEEELTPVIVPVPKKAASQAAKKKTTKKPTKAKKPYVPVGKGPKGKRKVLMDEDQVRRLEADLAREQRILERERRLHEEEVKKLGLSSYKSILPKPLSITQNSSSLKQPLTDNQTDSELLNALLETVYQRRELKEAGAKVSIPNKGGHTRLGELANVKFLVVTANYNDLDVLHHLIYMSEANKARVRKNILDFAGFNFAEDSPAYQDRMNFLTSLGYDISRRIAFLLGLCPYKSRIAQQDLNELIMYFLMSPCQSKQVPIRHLPNTFFGNAMPDELSALMAKHSESISSSPVDTQVAASSTFEIPISENGSTLTPKSTPRQRAKKSFRSSLPPSERLGLTPSISTLQLSAPKRPIAQSSIMTPNQVLLSPKGAQSSPKSTSLAAQALARSIAKANATLSSNPEEFYIHQQTPDGHHKTFKLIKIPANHPLNTVIKQQTPTPVASLPKPITISPPVIGAPGLSPGLILFKDNLTNPALSSIMQTVPLAIGQPAATKLISSAVSQVEAGVPPVVVNKSAEDKLEEDSASADVDNSLEEKDSTVPVECSFSDEDAEELHPLEHADPPTDDELYNSIQDIIHSCASLEDITLKNVINQVSAEYPTFDLSPRHRFMKECVKKVIMGT